MEITITSAATTAQWANHRINIIDTRAWTSLSSERSLRVLGGAVALLDAQSGVEPQKLKPYGVRLPLTVFLVWSSSTDGQGGADFLYSVEPCTGNLQANAHPVQLPIWC